MTTLNSNTTAFNSDDDFDPMSESSFQPELVSEEKYNEIKTNGERVKAFHTKFAIIRAKYEATFVDGIASENDWTNEDASLYEQYETEKNNLPTEWNISGYKIAE